MSKTTLKIGFVGAGAIHFGRPEVPWDHASRLEKIGGIEVIGIVDPDTRRSDEVLKERLASPEHGHMYTHCRLLTDYRELLGMKPDVVLIGIPPAFRGSPKEGKNLELEFAQAGIHVFVEKPLSLVLPEEFTPYACSVAEACRTNNVVLSVGYMFRYHAAVLKMKELIAQHGGKVMAFNARYYFAYTEGINKYWFQQEFSGGPIVEQATHFCDLARYIVGDIDMTSLHTLMLNDSDKGGAGKLNNQSEHAEDDIPSSKRIPRVTLSHWRFQDGGLGTLMHSVTLPGSRYQATIDVQLDGLQLSLIDPYESTSILKVRTLEGGNPNQEQDFVFKNDDTYLRELDTFIKAVRQGKQSLIKSSYEDAMKTYELTWAIRRQGEVKD
ncbi:uncharacterized protein UNK4.17-like isoform X3 [Mizuhopecten yessoensis]|uniref:Uncharacterized protein UNK4.17 n=2 Tax=Mizuhopecten yessoensis TaxID=6573 RepID=A0A210QCI7_MIZYE|nr:uncharacterized protein UNK4.17-like isoform X3 [Mizuhopecten yessoensis]OWF46463.1 Uncharacterized protein UNK4.17 [Mizuhopecten yessoensis]